MRVAEGSETKHTAARAKGVSPSSDLQYGGYHAHKTDNNLNTFNFDTNSKTNVSKSHDFTKGPFDVASVSVPSNVEAPFVIENLSHMGKKNKNEKQPGGHFGKEINDTANFKDDESFKLYYNMINEIGKNGPHMQVEYEPQVTNQPAELN